MARVEQQIPKAPTMNPWVQGGLAGADVLAQILGEIFGEEDPMEQLLRFNLDQKKKLIPQFNALPQGHSEGEVVKMQSASNRAMQPALDKIAFNQDRMGGRGSPQAGRNAGFDIASILGDQEFDIRKYLGGLGQRRTEFKLGGLAGMVG